MSMHAMGLETTCFKKEIDADGYRMGSALKACKPLYCLYMMAAGDG